MPIKSRPLLEYWLRNMENIGVNGVLVNTHYYSEYVSDFLQNSCFNNNVCVAYENELLGTAGTIRKNSDFYKDDTLLLVHADNWSCCNYSDFLNYHYNCRPKDTLITMMTFTCENPLSCGIVELDNEGIVTSFHEKVDFPPGNLANAAVYLLDPIVIDWIKKNTNISDFSTEVLPHFMGQIATWENKGIHRDIGTIDMLIKAQTDNCDQVVLGEESLWQQQFLKHPIHELIK
jgi:mannose-1-phosphate guanylyltransferase